MESGDRLTLIRLKVEALLKAKEQLQGALLQQQALNLSLKQKLEEYQKREQIAEETNKISKLAEGIQLSGIDGAALKKELNQQIRRIDECLKLLNQMSDNT